MPWFLYLIIGYGVCGLAMAAVASETMKNKPAQVQLGSFILTTIFWLPMFLIAMPITIRKAIK